MHLNISCAVFHLTFHCRFGFVSNQAQGERPSGWTGAQVRKGVQANEGGEGEGASLLREGIFSEEKTQAAKQGGRERTWTRRKTQVKWKQMWRAGRLGTREFKRFSKAEKSHHSFKCLLSMATAWPLQRNYHMASRICAPGRSWAANNLEVTRKSEKRLWVSLQA